ncbi:MAG: bifunctional aspartate kinase/homoserine dehydrogenase I, partial [Spirochaetales bacterium]|nr:bifunctional aspartate kinase/homoserine dehydrogenase I [Candidatus Physcosoma equi]
AKILSARFNDEGAAAAVYSPETLLEKGFSFPEDLKVAFIAGSLIYCDNDHDASGREDGDEGWGEYTAALVSKKLHAPLTFWNQRSLFYSASHKDVPNAHIIRSMTYAEATELSFFGAPVVHPHSFIPAEEAKVPLSLRYWGDISEPGTLITATDESDKKNPVKAFSVVKNISLINVEGSGMSGVPGVSSRLFTALRNEHISVIFISQASSEYSICFAVPQIQAAKAKATLVSEFSEEIAAHQISSIETEQDLSILAVVGEGMPGAIGIAGKFFSSLARAGVNIRAIAQGSSERNISAVISSSDAVKAERALHSVFFMSEQTLSLGLFGPGNIGGTLLDQIGRESERLKREFDLDIRVRGIATSKKMLLSEDGIDLSIWRDQLEKYGIAYNEAIFLNHIKASYYPHWVLVDSTASADRAMQYKNFLEQGFHVITPNKKASSGPYDYYTSLFETSRKTGKKFLYETTVGAGLPIIVTLKDLRETGDRIEKVEGMVSGTLAWLFSNYDGTVPFSEMVKKAMSLGYTEPDPRDDLSGMDVGRKTVILARELGYHAEVADLAIENLVPEHLRSCSKEEFLERIGEMDAHMLEFYKYAQAHGKKLRYVGTVNNGKLSVSLAQFPVDHPFSQAKGTDNVIEFTTERYHKQPLVVQGPGAGPEVTAAGIFADVLRLSAYLGSKI